MSTPSSTTPSSETASSTAANPAEGMGYSAKKTAEVVGITYRQLDYWARTDLVTPSFTKARGSGSRRQYAYSDLLKLKAIKSMLDAGLKLESVRDVVDYLRDELNQDLSTANLVISGKGSVLVRSGEELVDALRGGQGVLNVLPLGGVKEELDAKIIELFPTEMTETIVSSDEESATGS